jgi:hypothetical protein
MRFHSTSRLDELGPVVLRGVEVPAARRQGVLWLLNGPASFQGEPVPAGLLTKTGTATRVYVASAG